MRSLSRTGARIALVASLVVLVVAAATPAGAPSASRPSVASAAVPRPSAAFSLGDNGLSPAAISLNWTASTAGDFENYSVLYSTKGATGPWTFYTAVTDEDTPTAVVSGLAPGATYWWNITAYSSGVILGLGASTTYSSILEKSQPTLAYLQATKETSDSVTVNWTNNASYGGGIAFGYYVVAVENGGTTTYGSPITTVATNSTTVDGLSPGTSGYSFYLETYDCIADCPGASPHYSLTESNVVVAGTPVALAAAVSPVAVTTDVGLPVSFACTPAGGTPPYSYGWNFTSGSTYAAEPGTTGTTYAAAGTDTVTCEVTDHTGTKVVTDPVTVTVNPAPKVVASAAPVNVTAGTSVAFTCTATPGSPPLSVNWTFGDGGHDAASPGSDVADASWSYGAAGTYIAQCSVLDNAGGRAVASVTIHVTPKPTAPWFTAPLVLAGGIVAGLVVALVAGVGRRRDEESRRSSAMSRWLPPTGPAATVHGAKVCPKCGASNVPLRRTCKVCGTPLPRNPSP
jgi:hypothetical protein